MSYSRVNERIDTSNGGCILHPVPPLSLHCMDGLWMVAVGRRGVNTLCMVAARLTVGGEIYVDYFVD